ncbi:hypothetical protein B0H14DRAFT_3510085 [Mycena olivaceomarginata]|nr:hypothetical protein B0H14DRAFT_3510085 [Mycena olivaceomarginata]
MPVYRSSTMESSISTPWDYLTRPYHLCIDDAHNPLRPANRAQAIIPQDIPQFQSSIGTVTMFPPDPIHTIEHNAVDKERIDDCRYMSSSTASARPAMPSPCMSSLRLFGVRSGVYLETPPACTRHTTLTPATGPSTSSARPIHTNITNPRSASSILAFISIAHEHISSPPYAIQLRPPACHRRPSPVHTAPPHPPFIDRVCVPADGVCEEVLGGLGLRLRAAASDRSRRKH